MKHKSSQCISRSTVRRGSCAARSHLVCSIVSRSKDPAGFVQRWLKDLFWVSQFACHRDSTRHNSTNSTKKKALISQLRRALSTSPVILASPKQKVYRPNPWHNAGRESLQMKLKVSRSVNMGSLCAKCYACTARHRGSHRVECGLVLRLESIAQNVLSINLPKVDVRSWMHIGIFLLNLPTSPGKEVQPGAQELLGNYHANSRDIEAPVVSFQKDMTSSLPLKTVTNFQLQQSCWTGDQQMNVKQLTCETRKLCKLVSECGALAAFRKLVFRGVPLCSKSETCTNAQSRAAWSEIERNLGMRDCFHTMHLYERYTHVIYHVTWKYCIYVIMLYKNIYIYIYMIYVPWKCMRTSIVWYETKYLCKGQSDFSDRSGLDLNLASPHVKRSKKHATRSIVLSQKLSATNELLGPNCYSTSTRSPLQKHCLID